MNGIGIDAFVAGMFGQEMLGSGTERFEVGRSNQQMCGIWPYLGLVADAFFF